jgi:hypothetical protein
MNRCFDPKQCRFKSQIAIKLQDRFRRYETNDRHSYKNNVDSRYRHSEANCHHKNRTADALFPTGKEKTSLRLLTVYLLATCLRRWVAPCQQGR